MQYPGREDRFCEPPLTELPALVREVTAELADGDERPMAFFGHSMGGAVAHEVALSLAGSGGAEPVHLIVSAREPVEHVVAGSVHLGGEAALRAELTRLGGTSRELLDHAELWRLMAPVLLADYRLIETYRPVPGRRLRCPVTAFAAADDSELTPGQAADWAQRDQRAVHAADLPRRPLLPGPAPRTRAPGAGRLPAPGPGRRRDHRPVTPSSPAGDRPPSPYR